jgi:hypothetical protein
MHWRIPLLVAIVGSMASGCDSFASSPNSLEYRGDDTRTSGTEGDGDTSSPAKHDAVGARDTSVSPDTRASSGDTKDASDTSGPSRPKLDLLWVVDNSASMCQEQQHLGTYASALLEPLGETFDLHVAVTTTHYDAASSRTPVAEPGHIQSTPSPRPLTSGICTYGYNEDGDLLDGTGTRAVDYTPLKHQIERAIECTRTPSMYKDMADFDEEHIKDTLEDRSVDTLFPPQNAYRSVEDDVLKTSDYRSSGGLDMEAMVRDFACMSFVGTRGSDKEQGLRAAVRAVSPETTGGPVGGSDQLSNQIEYNPNAPNHGLLRRDASFGVVFLTDENDCSLKKGRTLPDEGCLDRECYYLSRQSDPNPLEHVKSLQERFVSNLARSKGLSYDADRPEAADTLDPDDVFAASIHGPADSSSIEENNPLTDDNETCTGGEYFVEPVCANNQLGRAYTGGRYANFVQGFEHTYPTSSNEGAVALCENEMASALERIRDQIIDQFGP